VPGQGGTLTGALLFFYSDAILAWNRFVNPIPFGRIVKVSLLT
jgi:hypothetical protein